MDSLPPNNPNNNTNPNTNTNQRTTSKEQPYDGRRRNNNNGETMDVVGDLQDSPVVVAMFLSGLVGWLLRERCIC
jgi:hypothetical protein